MKRRRASGIGHRHEASSGSPRPWYDVVMLRVFACCVAVCAGLFAQDVYVANQVSDDVTVFAAASPGQAVTIPVGHTTDGLPVGMQLIGPKWSDHKILSMGEEISSVLGQHFTPPPIVNG